VFPVCPGDSTETFGDVPVGVRDWRLSKRMARHEAATGTTAMPSARRKGIPHPAAQPLGRRDTSKLSSSVAGLDERRQWNNDSATTLKSAISATAPNA
jgi:hypothetical protein